MWMVYGVFRANSFGSATVDIAKDQYVITTGPYAIVGLNDTRVCVAIVR